MGYLEYPAAADLRPLVTTHWTLEVTHTDPPVPEPILPDGHPELVFHYGDRFSHLVDGGLTVQPRAAIIGQTLGALAVLPGRQARVFGVRLRPAGLALLTRVPAHEFTGQVVDLASVVGPEGDRLLGAVANARDVAERIGHVERFLRARVQAHAGIAPENRRAVIAAAGIVQAREGRVSVDDLARHCALGPRQLHRQFLSAIGVAPKQFIRTIRFQRAVSLLERGRTITEVALDAGFYDHAHFTREFRALAGVSPSRHLQASAPLTAHFLHDSTDLYKPVEIAAR